MKIPLIAILLLATSLWAPRVHAASCSLSSGTGQLVDFGTFTSASGDLDATGNLTVTCTTTPPLNLPVPYSIAIGTGGAGTFNPRRLSSGGNSLRYNLYVDATRLLIWGDATSGTVKQSGSCTGGCTIPVYGRVFGSQAVPAGSYSDPVLVTLEF